MDLIEASPDDLTESLAFALLQQRKALQRLGRKAIPRAGQRRLPRHCVTPGRAPEAKRCGEGRAAGEPAAWDAEAWRRLMIDDPDIFRAAKLMIDKHGDEASWRAAQRANDLEKGGASSGCAIWRQIVTAIEELQRGWRDDEPVN